MIPTDEMIEVVKVKPKRLLSEERKAKIKAWQLSHKDRLKVYADKWRAKKAAKVEA